MLDKNLNLIEQAEYIIDYEEKLLESGCRALSSDNQYSNALSKRYTTAEIAESVGLGERTYQRMKQIGKINPIAREVLKQTKLCSNLEALIEIQRLDDDLQIETAKRMINQHYLYIIRQSGIEADDLVGDSFYKIGNSKNPESRLKTLQTSNPNELELIFTFGSHRKDESLFFERWMHQLFSPFREKGEWFLMPDEIVQTFMEDVQKRMTWEKENIEEAKEEMTTGLFYVMNSEKWSQQSMMELSMSNMIEVVNEELNEEEKKNFVGEMKDKCDPEMLSMLQELGLEV